EHDRGHQNGAIVRAGIHTRQMVGTHALIYNSGLPAIPIIHVHTCTATIRRSTTGCQGRPYASAGTGWHADHRQAARTSAQALGLSGARYAGGNTRPADVACGAGTRRHAGAEDRGDAIAEFALGWCFGARGAACDTELVRAVLSRRDLA